MASTPQDAGVPAIDPGAPTVPTPQSESSVPDGQAAESTGEENDFVPKPDAVLADKFKLERLLGRGGMGEVWVAEHMTLKSPVAIKLIDAKIAKDELAINRFMREAQSAANLRGRNVVQILDYGVDGATPYIAMELLEGESLAQRLKRKTKLEADEAVSVIADVCRAVGRAHEVGIVHRDLKPDNIFIVHDADSELAKVLDFGIAKAPSDLADTGDRASTQTGALLGTPYYMSPEQAKNSKKADPRSDIWAVGVIAYECVVGERPFYSDQITDLVLQICTEPLPVPSEHASVPPGFDVWFAKACARDVDDRYQTAKELIDGLRAAVGVGSASVSMISPAPKSGGSTWLWGGAAVAAGVAGFLLFGGGGEPAKEDVVAKAPPPVAKAEPKQEPEPLPEPELEPEPAPPTDVTIELEGAPEGARVFIDGEEIGPANEAFQLPHGDEEVELKVTAKGYADYVHKIRPSTNWTSNVSMEKKRSSKTAKSDGATKPKPPVTF